MSASTDDNVQLVSAITGQGLDALLEEITTRLEGKKTIVEFILPYSDGRKRAWLFEQGVVEQEKNIDEGVQLTVRWTPKQEKRFRDL